MARGTTLVNLRQMLKAECGIELDETITAANDSQYNLNLANQQKWLAGQHAFLLGKARTTVALTAGTRYYTFPETVLDIDRLDEDVFVKLGASSPAVRYRVMFGIGQEEYYAYDSEATPVQTASPVLKWDLVWDTTLKIEVWPVPNAAQTLCLSGVKVLSALVAPTDTADLDDMLIVLFTAAEILARRKDSDAGAKLAKAQAHLTSLKGSRQSKYERFSLKGGPDYIRHQVPRPIIGTSTN